MPYFNRPHSREKATVDELIESDRAALIGPILAEILQGFRRTDQADWVASSLQGLHYFEPTWNDWRRSAQLGRELASRGRQLPLTDLVVASVSLRTGCAVYTTDPHFDLIPDLKRYRHD
ncbi:MAG: PIN domain-containing protein [Planctomycetaceae bacterium]